MHKTHSNAWGEDLPEDVRRQLYAYSKPPPREGDAPSSPGRRGREGDAPSSPGGADGAAPSRGADGAAPSRPWLRNFHADVLPYLSLQGIVAPSAAGWYRFLARMRVAEAEQTRFSVEAAKRIAEGVVAANVDAKLAADYLTAKALDAATAPDEASQKASAILATAAAKFHQAAVAAEKLKLDAARQKTADEQLKLAREKFEAAERRESAAKATLGDKKMTDADKLAKMKEIFG